MGWLRTARRRGSASAGSGLYPSVQSLLWRMRRTSWWVTGAALALCARLGAQVSYPDAIDDLVVDHARVLSPAVEESIRGALRPARAEGLAIVVLTVESLAKYRASAERIDAYGDQVMNTWGIGQEDNRGALLLVSRDDRKVSIRLGRGLASLGDTVPKEVLDQVILPRLREDDWAGGILEGARALKDRLKSAAPAGATTVPAVGRSPTRSNAPTRWMPPIGGRSDTPRDVWPESQPLPNDPGAPGRTMSIPTSKGGILDLFSGNNLCLIVGVAIGVMLLLSFLKRGMRRPTAMPPSGPAPGSQGGLFGTGLPGGPSAPAGGGQGGGGLFGDLGRPGSPGAEPRPSGGGLLGTILGGGPRSSMPHRGGGGGGLGGLIGGAASGWITKQVLGGLMKGGRSGQTGTWLNENESSPRNRPSAPSGSKKGGGGPSSNFGGGRSGGGGASGSF